MNKAPSDLKSINKSELHALFESIGLPHYNPTKYWVKRTDAGYQVILNSSEEVALELASDHYREPKFNHDETHLALSDASSKTSFALWNVEQQKVELSLSNKKVGLIHNFCFHPNRNEVAVRKSESSFFKDDYVWAYRKSDKNNSWSLKYKIDANLPEVISYSPDSRWLGVMLNDITSDRRDHDFQKFTLWTLVDYKKVWQCSVAIPDVHCINKFNFVFSNRGNWVAIENADHIVVYTLFEDTPVAKITEAVHSPVFSENDDYFAASNGTNTVVYNTQDWLPRFTVTEFGNSNNLSFSIKYHTDDQPNGVKKEKPSNGEIMQRTWSKRSSEEDDSDAFIDGVILDIALPGL